MDQDTFVLSKFGIIQESKDGSLILYNSMAKRIVKVSAYEADIIKDIYYNNKNLQLNTSTLKQLATMGFLVPVGYDENVVANVEYLKEVMNPTLGLTIVPTFRCNFRCPYCYQDHENSEIMSNDTQDAILKYVRKNISKYTGVEISWFGGEPLLCTDIILKLNHVIKEICTKRYKPFKSTITTNGYCLTKETFEQLYESGLHRYFITIDGIEQMHDKQRYLANKKGTFHTIIKNLQTIKTLPKSKRFIINLRTNVSLESLAYIKDYIAYMHERFSDDERFSFFFRPVFDWGGKSIETFKENLLEAYSGFHNIFKELINSEFKMNYLEHYLDLTQSAICYASKLNHYIINPNGEINKCTCSDIYGNNLVGKLDITGSMTLDMPKIGMWVKQYQNAESCDNCRFHGLCHKAYCVADMVMNNNQNIKCYIAKYSYEDVLALLDKCNDKYKYINTIK